MGATQYYTATSLDGYIADENNSLDWLFEVDRGDDAGESYEAFFADVGAMAMGATTYEWVLGHERVLEEPDKWRAWYGDTPCWVFTHRTFPVVPGANIVFVEGDVAPVHEQMADAAGGKNVWLVGGGELVGQFHDHGLLDELFVQFGSVTLGAGKPLLPRTIVDPPLKLLSVRAIGTGFAELNYEVQRVE